MPENGKSTLREFKEKFTELNGVDYTTKLKFSDAIYSIQASTPTASIREIDLTGLCLVDEEDARLVLREEMAAIGESIATTKVFTIWGGAIDPSGVSSIIEPILQDAMNRGSGIEYGGQLYQIRDYKKGLVVGGIVMEWFLFTDRIITNIR